MSDPQIGQIGDTATRGGFPTQGYPAQWSTGILVQLPILAGTDMVQWRGFNWRTDIRIGVGFEVLANERVGRSCGEVGN